MNTKFVVRTAAAITLVFALSIETTHAQAVLIPRIISAVRGTSATVDAIAAARAASGVSALAKIGAYSSLPSAKDSTVGAVGIAASSGLSTSDMSLQLSTERYGMLGSTFDTALGDGVTIAAEQKALATLSLEESDVRAVCEKERDAAHRNLASARVYMALSANAGKLGSPYSRRDDDVQDLFLKLLRKCDEILAGKYANLPGYLFTVVANDQVDKLRGEIRSRQLFRQTADVAAAVGLGVAADSGHLAAKVATEQRLKNLEKVREALTSRQKEVLDGLTLGRSSAEIASDLGISAERVGEIRGQIKKKYLHMYPSERWG
ncbi:sigma-70 family RNA polymerase sigma factor [Bradyrhizobium sp. 1.29L]